MILYHAKQKITGILLDDLKNHKFIKAITPLVLFIYLIINGVLGVKFGNHWDEWLFIAPAIESLNSGIFLPHSYIYPSLCYYIVLAAAGVYKIIFGINDASALISDNNFYHFVRCIFIFISSLTVIWVYLLTAKITKNYFSSLIAGLIICSSFEFSYHSRWAVSDCIAVQFVTLSALILFLNISTGNKIIFSSLVAGFAAGTKYTGGIAFISILIFILNEVSFKKENLKTAAVYIIYMMFFLLTGFLITTPGAVLEYNILKGNMIFQNNIYSNGHYGHTVEAGFSHLIKIGEYVMFVLFSKNHFISMLIFLLAFTGIASILIRKKWYLTGLFVTMLIYVVYVSSFSVMIVRNLLYILPFFAVLAAIGFDYLSNIIQKFKPGYAFRAIIIIMLIYSCTQVIAASLTIKNKSRFNVARELEKYMKANNDMEFILSSKVSSRLKVPKSTNIDPSENSYLVFFKSEVPFQLYTANKRDQFTEIIGIEDINFDYYPTWCGEDRIIIQKYLNASEDILYLTLKKLYPENITY